MPYFVYILECVDGTLYTGSTNDLQRRLKAHNNSKSGAHYTKIRRPVVLKYSEKLKNRSVALKKEIALKKLSRAQKMDLILTARH
ncbi:TPA: endonuclease [Candidatus Taylorbacteria bacterium]|nr:endonuclease [Candidatus Taylorbacteria bacterium]